MTDLELPLQGRPLPLVDEVNRPFFEGAARGVLRFQRCNDTGRLQHYPRPRSVYTGGEVTWVEVSGAGVVYSFRVIRQNQGAPAFQANTPYIVALIDLNEGVRMMGNVIAGPGAGVRIGMAVRAAFYCIDPEASLHLPFWIPSDIAGA